MRFLIPALCSAVALAGCQTTDAAIQRNLAIACSGIEISNGIFTDLAASLQLKATTIKLEADSYAEAAKLCANPGTDTVAVTAAVTNLAVRITLAVLEAKRARDVAGK